MRKRTSPIWITPKNELEEIVKNNETMAEILRSIGLDPYGSGSRYRSLKKRFKEDDIDYSHIILGSFSRQGKKFPTESKPLEEVMVENSTYSRGALKKRLLKNGMLENKCDICDQEPIHNSTKLVMILDHINGVRNDHREENLRLLCPNCNSQQPTFAGRSNKKPMPQCKECGKNISRKSKSGLCQHCFGVAHVPKRVENRPSREQLLKDMEEINNYCVVGKKYGVSDNCIRKWLK
jgi:Zn finger protein HypA/HybF involved in hydrogenase expression